MRSILASVLVATAFSTSSAQELGYNAFGAKGAVISVQDGCDFSVDVDVTRSSDSGGRKRAQGVWVDAFDDKAKGKYTLSEGSSTVQGTVRTGYSASVTNPKVKYSTAVQTATNGDYAYFYRYCSGAPFEDPRLALADIESDDLFCDVSDAEGPGIFDFTVQNTMFDTVLTGLRLQVTFDPPIDYKTVLGPAGVSVRAPRSRKNTLGSFRPAIKSTSLRPDGGHYFTITTPAVDYDGKVTIRATASGGKVCVTEMNLGSDFAITTRNGVRVGPAIIEAVPVQNPEVAAVESDGT